jgi:hypothetical protein
MGNYVYAVYETDAGTRVYLYFRRSDDYSHLGGYVILMNRALYQSDFIGLKKGDTMADVLRVDPNTALYLQAYDAEEATWLLNPDGSGWQITTTHLLRDGVLRYRYELEAESQPRRYVIREVEYSPEFTLAELGGDFCYEILQQDFAA